MAIRAPGLPGPPRALPVTEVLVGRIGWLVRLRWVAIAGTVAFVEIGRRVLPIHLEHRRIYLVLLAVALYNLITWLAVRRAAQARKDAAAAPPPEVPPEPGPLARLLLPHSTLGARHYDADAGVAAVLAAAQIVLDLFFLAVLLHFTGGIENPLWVFFVFHVIVASVLLSRHATYGVALYGTALLWDLALGEYHGWWPHYGLGVHRSTEWYTHEGLLYTHLFLQGVTLFIAAYLASSIAGRLRRREVDVMVLSWHLSDQARELERACAELTAAEHAKSQYLRNVAHELRAPLSTIKTALTLVLQTSAEGMSPQTRHLIERAERRLGELADMTRALLTLSRVQGVAAAETAPVSLPELLHPVLEEFQHQADAAGLETVIELPAALPVVEADGEALSDLVANLAGNAVRYTPAGGVVGVRVEWRDGGLHLEVWDTGIGILESDRARIFDEFYRAPAARERTPDGSGLGLSIVRAVVERYHGSIRVESREGEGTRFFVALPLEVLPHAWQPA